MPSDQPAAARPPRRRSRAPGFRLRHVVLLAALLIPCGLALQRLAAVVDYRWLAAYAVGISLATYGVYGADKDSAEDKASRWRAPERLLHALELAGGWPAAFVAQRRLRHKCSKFSYQLTYWCIVAIHVGLAADYAWGWRATQAMWRHWFPPGP